MPYLIWVEERTHLNNDTNTEVAEIKLANVQSSITAVIHNQNHHFLFKLGVTFTRAAFRLDLEQKSRN
jgi:hypothetical protein